MPSCAFTFRTSVNDELFGRLTVATLASEQYSSLGGSGPSGLCYFVHTIWIAKDITKSL